MSSVAGWNKTCSYSNEKPGAWSPGYEASPIATEAVWASQRTSSRMCLFQLFPRPISLLLSRTWTQGKRDLFITEARAEMLTCAATKAGLHERTDGWGCGALVHSRHLYSLCPRCATAALPAFGKQTGGKLGIKLVMDQESRGRRKEPQLQREDEGPRDRPC